MINLIKYQQEAFKFANDLGQNKNILHAVFGVKDEVGELVGAIKKHLFYGKELDMVNIKEELGDALWFAALGLTSLDMPVAFPTQHDDLCEMLYELDGIVMASDLLWDTAFENAKINGTYVYLNNVEKLAQPFAHVVASVHQLCRVFHLDIMDVAATNLAKLNKRYSEGKFNKDHAINRNLEAEREVLENYEVPNQ